MQSFCTPRTVKIRIFCLHLTQIEAEMSALLSQDFACESTLHSPVSPSPRLPASPELNNLHPHRWTIIV